MKKIRLVIFNEEYWSKGLIYTQNILPIKKLCDETNSQMELYSFTSLPMYVMHHSTIKSFMSEMKDGGISIHNMPVLFYPTRLMTVKWFMLPFFYLNVFLYVKYLLWKDRKEENVIYNCRSYYTSLAFLKFYKNKNKLIFDPRTDWIEEKVNAGSFNIGSWTYKMWLAFEKDILSRFSKSLFISDVFKDNLLKRHSLADESKFMILYNPINYNHFTVEKKHHDGIVFLYTGSLGKWNRLENYLEFFKKYHSQDSNSRLVICTNSSSTTVNSVMNREEFNNLKQSVEVYYNVSYNDLPIRYSECDFGLQIMSKEDSRVGVKYIEYIAAELTPIVNENVQGATYLARKYNIGIVINGQEDSETIYEKVQNCKRINRADDNYLKIQSLTDVNKLTSNLSNIYLG